MLILAHFDYRETVQALSNDVEHLKCAHDSLQEEKDSLSGLVETLEREKANLVDEMSDLLGDSTCLKERLAEKEKESCRLREKLDVVEVLMQCFFVAILSFLNYCHDGALSLKADKKKTKQKTIALNRKASVQTNTFYFWRNCVASVCVS